MQVKFLPNSNYYSRAFVLVRILARLSPSFDSRWLRAPKRRKVTTRGRRAFKIHRYHITPGKDVGVIGQRGIMQAVNSFTLTPNNTVKPRHNKTALYHSSRAAFPEANFNFNEIIRKVKLRVVLPRRKMRECALSIPDSNRRDL